MPPMPPMGGGMPNEDPMMGGEPPIDMDNTMGEQGAEEDPENGPGADVKKYSGELSQALNTYNDENPSDEEKINKYAANMIAAQVADYLSDKDKRSVIKKLQGDDGDASDGMSPDEQPQFEEPMQQMENRIVKEIADELLNGRKGARRSERFITNDEISGEDNPFVSKR